MPFTPGHAGQQIQVELGSGRWWPQVSDHPVSDDTRSVETSMIADKMRGSDLYERALFVTAACFNWAVGLMIIGGYPLAAHLLEFAPPARDGALMRALPRLVR
jgi:hypothetical protein